MSKGKGAYPTCWLPHLKKVEALIDKEIEEIRDQAQMNIVKMLDIPIDLVEEPEYQPLVQKEMLRLKKESKE